ncbi:hypothetical protein [Pseudochelatococcus contaminans]|uniref:Uncharacterized protein n=1 Tax=Pseudochelatococcus contaminans TaxID=1538103 RepID=A0A7W6EI41_9HYPH|nr:hypothetical protein [Pseudochelatococcus contaminans]MBB3810769.1 hypothetical protein [Pseudochelatococcus contaminans]
MAISGNGDIPNEPDIPVVGLRAVIAPPVTPAEEKPVGVDSASEEAAPSASMTSSPSPVSQQPRRQNASGWIVPFLAGVLVGAAAFYALLWAQALI